MSHYEVCKTILPFLFFFGGVGVGCIDPGCDQQAKLSFITNDAAQSDLSRARFREAKQDNANRPAGGQVTSATSLSPLLRGRKK